MKFFKIFNLYELFLYSSFFLMSFGGYSQGIEGFVKDSIGAPISSCNIILLNNGTVINYTTPDVKGYYRLELNDDAEYSIMVQGINFNSIKKDLKPSKNGDIRQDFILTYKVTALKEVIIKERPKVSIRNDTVVYDAKKFKDVDDEKLIDILENMPGISVNKTTGEIQYKGKSIETILLDGEDLFGKSYAVGAKNISSEIIDQVEAIEDYHESDLTKGLRRNEEVAINLKFKKGISQLNGEISAAFGFENRMINANALLLKNRIKGFGVFESNNISINNSPYASQIYRSENKNEVNSPNYFEDSNLLFSNNTSNRSYINDLNAFNYDNLFKISNKLSLKSRLGLSYDQNYNANDIQSNYVFEETEIFRKISITKVRSPKIFNHTNELKYDISENSKITYSNKIYLNEDRISQTNRRSDDSIFFNSLKRKQIFQNHNFFIQTKINQDLLLEVESDLSFDRKEDVIKLKNGDNPQKINQINFGLQDVNLLTNNIDLNIGLLHKIKENLNLKYGFMQGFERLTSEVSQSNQEFSGRTNLLKSALFFKTQFFFVEKFQFDTEIFFNRLDGSLYREVNLNRKYHFLSGIGRLKYALNPNNSVILKYEIDKKFNETIYLNYVNLLVDNQNFLISNPNLSLFQNHIWSLMYSNINLIRQSNISVNANFQTKNNSIFHVQNINQNISYITQSSIPRAIDDFSVSFSRVFLFEGISNKVNLSGNYNYSKYYNSINNQGLIEASSQIYNFNLGFKSAFNGWYNYNFDVSSVITNSKENDRNSITSSTLFVNTKSIMSISENLFGRIETEFSLPQGENANLNNSNFYLDASFNYKRNNFNYFLKAGNILNYNNEQIISSTEFSTTYYARSIYSRFVVLGLNYSF